MPLIELDNKIFTPSWMEFIKSEGFMKSSENNQFMVYFKVDKKIKDYVAAGETLVCIVIAKTFTHDFLFGKCRCCLFHVSIVNIPNIKNS